MKGLLSVLLYRLSCSRAYPTRRALTVPLQTNQNISPKTLESGQKCKHVNKRCLFNSDANVIYLQFKPDREILS